VCVAAVPAAAQNPVPAPPGPPAPQALEILVRPLAIGDRAVTGVIVPAPASAAGFFVEIRDGQTFLDRRPIEKVDPATGAFTVDLPVPLGPARQVTVGKTGDGAVTVSVATKKFTAEPMLHPLHFDGTRTVRGYLKDQEGTARVRVLVHRSALENSLGGGYLQVKTTSDIAEGQFSVVLDQPLLAGQVLTAEALTAGNDAGPASAPITITDPGSWGRARAYFSGGVIFSKARSDFSEQDMVLTFTIDKSIIQKPDFRMRANQASKAAAIAKRMAEGLTAATATIEVDQEAASVGRISFRQLNTVFDTRLTALPVLTDGTTASAPQFVDSKKGALMQIAVYAPFYGPQSSWVHDGTVNTFFIAPLFRGGIQTIIGEDGVQTTNAKGEPDDVYRFVTAGFAVGHQKLSGTTDQTPEMISYLHMSWGYAEAFDYRDGDGVLHTPVRMLVEGRLKVPYTGLQVGFDANLGDGRDDIRFIFGTRFDIGEALSRIRGFEP
jgi:hypothetical protein